VSKTFVGIGFGPTQSGLFLLEAQASGNFERVIVVEVQPEIVNALRSNHGRATVNVAHCDGLSTHDLHEIEIYNPLDSGDVPRIVEAIAAADEIATALPSTDFFQRGQPTPAQLLARGFYCKLVDDRLPRAIVYAAENHNQAAERLADAVLAELEAIDRPRLADRVAFLNTVIGKMSGVVTDRSQLERYRLAPFVDGAHHAVLVEAFNRILISRVPWSDFQRGIAVFAEKSDLLPYEEAKLYGHNAAHALLGYLAHQAKLTYIHETDDQLRGFVRRAFLEESGVPLCRRYPACDPLFTPQGWNDYVEDLMVRMVNPYLQDRVDRVIRDPQRKLQWDDRLIGTMRLALGSGVDPNRYAVGAAAAVQILTGKQGSDSLATTLEKLWERDHAPVDERNSIIACIREASENSLIPHYLSTS
jgi:mannitol-1-phosphate 5-dehydrogenase